MHGASAPHPPAQLPALARYSWNAKANVIYIDQPTGTGFSYGHGLDHDEKGVASDMYDFLQQFFKAHTKYNKLPFYAVGESCAHARLEPTAPTQRAAASTACIPLPR